jgi:hypothetical protein
MVLLTFCGLPLLKAQTLCEQYPGFTPDVTIGQNNASITFASQIPAPPYPGWVNKNILIRGALIADVHVYFFNCTVKMGPGASVKTQDNVVVSAFSSRFFSCEQMWRGFELQQGSLFSFWNTTFEDAQYTLSIDDGVTGNLAYCRFNRNHIGIRNQNAVSGQSGLTFQYFGSNTFTCDGALNSPYPGQSPDPGATSFAGIYLEQCAATIGLPGYGMNTFSHMRYGIYARRADLAVRACRFEHMAYVNGDGGIGIYAEDGSLLVDAPYANETQLTDPCEFNGNEEIGISGSGANLNIRNARFFGPQPWGIASYNNLEGEEVIIWSNDFSMDHAECFMAIQVERPVASGSEAHLTVAFNEIDMLSLNQWGAMYGINIAGPETAIDHTEIYRNTIDAVSPTSSLYPVYISGFMGDSYRTFRNDIQFANSPGVSELRWGIAMIDCFGFNHEVYENRVEGNSSFPGQCGIHLDEAIHVEVCDNFLNFTRRGIHLNGNNNPCFLRNNSINFHEEGLLVNDGSVSPGINGPQIRHGNTWLDQAGAYVNWAAECLSDPDLSKFFTESGDPVLLPPLRTPGGDVWFKYEEGELNYCTPDFPDSVGWTELDQQLAEGSFFDSTATPLLVWKMEKGLYFRLLRFPELLLTAPAAEDFFNNTADPSGMAYALAEYELWKSVGIDPALQAQLDELSQVREALLTSLMALDEPGSPVDTFGVDPLVYGQKAILLDSLKALAGQWYTLREQAETARLSALAGVEALLGQLPVETLYEQNQRYLLEVRIQAAKGIPFTANQTVGMLEMAASCPQTGGPAVREVLRWLPPENASQFLLDEPEPCLEEREPFAPLLTRPSGSRIRVSPNPATDQLHVFCTGEGRLRLFDVSGVLLREVTVTRTSQDYRIDVRDLPSGVYFIILEEGGQLADRLTFTVQH